MLDESVVAVHPFIIAELTLGHIRQRHEVLTLLRALPEASSISQAELLHFVEKRRLSGSGVGFVDAHLLAATELMRGLLWTADKKLHSVADRLNLAY